MTGGVVVVGSANLDLVYRVPRIPGPGETLLATSASEHEGGKGNNQVIAAARSGAAATFIAALGDDSAAGRLERTLDAAGVRILTRRADAPTGTALITVDDAGENAIVVNSGANALLTELTVGERVAIEATDTLLMQLEIPLETVAAAARCAHAAGVRVVLNAAPARELPDSLLELIDLLVVNEHEAMLLAGGTGESSAALPVAALAEALAAELLTRVRSVVITLGAEGALVAERDAAPILLPAARVTAVDTTGAGDTFCGALVAALSLGRTLPEACEFAAIAAAISVQRAGAVPSIPMADEIDRFRGQEVSA